MKTLCGMFYSVVLGRVGLYNRENGKMLQCPWNYWHSACILVLWAARRKGAVNVEDSLKQMMHDLGAAINDSLSESERIAEAIGEIRRSGYDVFLVLEATIGFNRRSDDGETGNEVAVSDSKPSKGATGKVRFTAQDERFLKALKIVSEG